MKERKAAVSEFGDKTAACKRLTKQINALTAHLVSNPGTSRDKQAWEGIERKIDERAKVLSAIEAMNPETARKLREEIGEGETL